MEEINKAQGVALSEIDASQINEGEFVYFIKSQEVYTGQQEPSKTLLEEESITVIEKKTYSDFIEYTLIKEVIDHLSEGSPHSKFKDVIGFSKVPSTTPSDPDPSPPEIPETIKFYNLKTSFDRIPRPQKVIDREPCKSSDGCLLNIKKISYDISFNEGKPDAQTTSVEIWISSEVPYFASILKNCFVTVIAVDTARPLVRQCKTVFDYIH